AQVYAALHARSAGQGEGQAESRARAMLLASDDAPKREGYRYEKLPGGGMVGYPDDTMPTINRRHIDGPLLYMRNGEMHWLTIWERILLRLGRTDAVRLERKYRPHLS